MKKAKVEAPPAKFSLADMLLTPVGMVKQAAASPVSDELCTTCGKHPRHVTSAGNVMYRCKGCMKEYRDKYRKSCKEGGQNA